jgi:hypothetical protein
MNEIVSKARSNLKETKKEVFLQSVTLINSAFALVAALAWNEAIKALLDRYFQAGSSVYSRFGYAIIITVFVVIISMRLSAVLNRMGSDANENSPQ